MEIKYQPINSRSCGQHCLAMIADKSIDEIAQLVGHLHSTNTRELISCLNKIGIKTDSKLRKFKNGELPPKLCIIKIRWDKGSHWVVCNKDQIYCPIVGIFDMCAWPYISRGKYSSYLEIKLES